MATKKIKVYEGKAKILYEGPDAGTLIQYFKDDATAFNNKKKGTIQSKGILNNRISTLLMKGVESMGIPTHYMKTLNMREQLVRRVEIIPLEVVIRNFAAGSFAERYGVEEGDKLPFPIVEFCYKKDEKGDPLITEDSIYALQLAEPEEVDILRNFAFRINDFLGGVFYGIGIRLV
ncbi:MAG: phosphoribosylaminoimidazolesuccinocarboxamide synthase, partial [Alphaproteobacteria bacterium]|nr:phosphoribosylaminoimidazolesuccinocarboxamide synthase [Alphaproteobacteria bacterium]